jgi:hypothetical protein
MKHVFMLINDMLSNGEGEGIFFMEAIIAIFPLEVKHKRGLKYYSEQSTKLT